MNSKGPKNYDAYTSWYVKWQFNWDKGDKDCFITSVTTTVDVKFTLPQWSDKNKADADLKTKWNKYYSALIRHENGHRDFGIRAAHGIEAAIFDLGHQSSCDLLAEKANKLGHRIIRNLVADEKSYDRRSNHGMNEGAIFP